MSEKTEAIQVIVDRVRRDGTVYACGCGGSMAQAQHLAAELTGRYQRERGPVAAIALGSNPAHLTAVANDYGFVEVFARELASLASPRDVLVAFSTSGRSAAVLAALGTAREQGIAALLVTGATELVTTALTDGEGVHGVHVVRFSGSTPEIQEATLRWIHELCAAIDLEVCE